MRMSTPLRSSDATIARITRSVELSAISRITERPSGALNLRRLRAALASTSSAWSELVSRSRGILLVCAPAIMRPSVSRSVSGGTMPTISPWYITAMRSASATTSSSSELTMMTAAPASRSAMMRLWTNSMDPTSRPRVGLRRDEQLERAREFACQHDLLLVAAGERSRGVEDGGGADVELLRHSSCLRPRSPSA